jgi:hypothetical protein
MMSDYYTTVWRGKEHYPKIKEWCMANLGPSMPLTDGVDTTGTSWIYSDSLCIILLATDRQRLHFDLRWS